MKIKKTLDPGDEDLKIAKLDLSIISIYITEQRFLFFP